MKQTDFVIVKIADYIEYYIVHIDYIDYIVLQST